MAKNYVARMNCHSSYALKNTCITDNVFALTDKCPSQYLNFIYIPNFDSIDLTQFDVFYSKNDTEHKYPFYRKIVGGGYSDKLNLGKAQITFFKVDESIYNVGVIDRERIKEDQETMYIDKNRYGAINPGTKDSSNRYQYSFDNDAPFTGYSPYKLFGIPEIQERINGKITGLPAMKDLEEGTDRWIIPIAGNDFKIGNNNTNYKGTWNIFAENDYSFLDTMQERAINNAALYAKNPDTEAWATSYNFGYQRGPAYISVPSNSPGYPSVYPMPIKYGDYADLNYAADTCWIRDNTNFNVSRAYPSCYGFMKNDNDEYYILTVSRDTANDTVVFLLYKLSSVPTTSDLLLNKNQENSAVIDQDETFTNRVNDVFPKLFFTAPINDYSGDAPDAVGPGDPYEDIDNTEGSVGGDTNTEKVIEDTHTGPNNSYDFVADTTRYFGSYYLTLPNLSNYSRTLSRLYHHSQDFIFGLAADLLADRIENGTTRLFMIPFGVPDDNMVTTRFVVGNAPIMASDGSYPRYIQNKNLEDAKLITKTTYEHTIDLGYLDHYYDNFLDFAPYSSASLFLPYIGKVELPINLIQSTSEDRKHLTMSIRINISTGDFMYILNTEIDGVNVPISMWNGNFAKDIQLSVNDNSPYIKAGFNQVASMFSLVASGGKSGSTGMTNASSEGQATTTNASQGMNASRSLSDSTGASHTVNASAGGVREGLSGSESSTMGHHGSQYKSQSTGQSSTSSIRSSKTNSNSTNKNISGSFNMTPSLAPSVHTNSHMIGNMSCGGEFGWLGIQRIILYVERPIWWKPHDYGNMMGYPTKKTVKLRSVNGFAKIPVSHIKCSMTSSEKEELAMMLAGGVIFDESDTV